VDVTIYTDPSCPFGFTAQRQELKLLWHYGEHIAVSRRMIVLAEETRPYTPEVAQRVAANRDRLRSVYRMPLCVEPPDRRVSTLNASRAYVGARVNDAAHAELLLRALRRRAMTDGEPLDELSTVYAAADDVGVGAETIDRWLQDGRVEAELRHDMAAARNPLPEARALAHRLSRADGELRYSAASAVFEHRGRRIVLPGFQPFAAYEVAVANVAPHLPRRPLAQTADEILAWASYPLATAEVAELREIDFDAAQAELESSGAEADGRGYWSSVRRRPARGPGLSRGHAGHRSAHRRASRADL
jgi:predicted DsbA family dithiol-disulfide isomerase